jgi:prepilin-type N-terminal cleavage/methylation domain-containing protein
VVKSKPSVRAFTLVELLVVIGIIAILIAILLPALNKARMQARKTQDLSNIKQIAVASVAYAAENKGEWPVGSRLGPDPTYAPSGEGDDLVWINYYTFGYFLRFMTSNSVANSWLSTTAPYPNGAPLEDKLKRSLACTSMQDSDLPNLSIVGEQTYRNYSSDLHETYMGFIFWARRSNEVSGTVFDNNGVQVSPTVNYVFPTKQGGTATSQTLVTCYVYAGPSYGCQLPHFQQQETFVQGPNCSSPNTPATLPMQGLCVAYTDGSAKWVPRKQLWSMKEGGFEWVYFDKTRP